MPLLLAATVLALGAWAWSSPGVRRVVASNPKAALFWGLVGIALVLVSFRTGRHWLGLAAAAALVWGPRLLRALGLMQQLRQPGATEEPPRPRSRAMSRAEALEVLGLGEGATPEQVLARYRQLMKGVHPDRGGSDYLAKRVNEAKSVLIGRV
jgi:hypothetical protein